MFDGERRDTGIEKVQVNAAYQLVLAWLWREFLLPKVIPKKPHRNTAGEETVLFFCTSIAALR